MSAGPTILGVLIDQREPEWVRRLAFDGAGGGSPAAVVTLLPAGDVQVATSDGCILVIERKTTDDLLSSIGDGRLFEQAARMLELSRWSYIVVCGDLQRHDSGRVITSSGLSGWDYASVAGALLTVQEMGVMVVHCGVHEFEAAVLRLVRRTRGEMPLTPARAPRWIDAGQLLLSSLPGIGQERAERILSYTGTAAAALQFLSDEDGKDRIHGVGPVLKRNVRSALGLPDWAMLAVIEKDERQDERLKSPLHQKEMEHVS